MQTYRTLIQAAVVIVGFCLAVASYGLERVDANLTVLLILFGTFGTALFAMLVADRKNPVPVRNYADRRFFCAGGLHDGADGRDEDAAYRPRLHERAS
jgi:hypothetical protein